MTIRRESKQILRIIELGAGGADGHGSNSVNHTGKRTDELTVGLDLWVRGQINTDMAVPGEEDVEKGIGDRECITHEVLATVQHVIGDIVELCVDFVNLRLLGLTSQAVEERDIQRMNFTG